MTMRYEIRTGEGTQFEVADGAQLIMLLRQQFLDADDQIRRRGQERWRRLGDIPEYREILKDVQAKKIPIQGILFAAFLLGCIAMIIAVLYRLGTTPTTL